MLLQKKVWNQQRIYNLNLPIRPKFSLPDNCQSRWPPPFSFYSLLHQQESAKGIRMNENILKRSNVSQNLRIFQVKEEAFFFSISFSFRFSSFQRRKCQHLALSNIKWENEWMGKNKGIIKREIENVVEKESKQHKWILWNFLM